MNDSKPHEYVMAINFHTYGGHEDSIKEFQELVEELQEKFPGWAIDPQEMQLFKV